MFKEHAAKAAALGVLGFSMLALTPVTAHADDLFAICPDGHSGIATAVTSCPFAINVRRAYITQGGPIVAAYSPVTNTAYDMQCQPGFIANLNNGQSVSAVRCVGGNNAVVILF